eukprot:tig00000808_g4422.t1
MFVPCALPAHQHSRDVLADSLCERVTSYRFEPQRRGPLSWPSRRLLRPSCTPLTFHARRARHKWRAVVRASADDLPTPPPRDAAVEAADYEAEERPALRRAATQRPQPRESLEPTDVRGAYTWKKSEPIVVQPRRRPRGAPPFFKLAAVNSEIMAAGRAGDPVRVVALLERHRDEINFVNLSTAVFQLGRAVTAGACSREWVLAHFETLIRPKFHELLDTATSRGVASLCYGLARCGIRDGEMLEALAGAAEERIRSFNAQEICNVAWALATLQERNGPLLEALSRRALEVLPDFSTQGLSNLAWAFAKLQAHDPALFSAVAGAAASVLPHFSSQGLSNLLWAFAAVQHRDEELLRRAAAELCTRMDDLLVAEAGPPEGPGAGRIQSQNIANIAWAFAKLGVRDEAMMARVKEVALPRLPLCSPQAVANLAWSFGTLKVADREMFRALAAAAGGMLPQFTSQGLSNLAWACATVSFMDGPFLRALAEEAAARIAEFNPQELSNTAWALASLGYDEPGAFDAITAAARASAGEMTGQGLSNILLAVANVQHGTEAGFVEALVEAALARPDITTQGFANCCFALTMLARTDLLERFLREQRAALRPEELVKEDCVQLGIVRLALRLQAPELLPLLPPEVCARIDEQHAAMALTPPASSELHVAIAAEVEGVRAGAVHEFFLEGYFLDLVFPGHRTALEVDGPAHYLTSGRVNGATELKRRLLAALGWRVLTVEYREWAALRSRTARHAFLEHLLADAPPPPPADPAPAPQSTHG